MESVFHSTSIQTFANPALQLRNSTVLLNRTTIGNRFSRLRNVCNSDRKSTKLCFQTTESAHSIHGVSSFYQGALNPFRMVSFTRLSRFPRDGGLDSSVVCSSSSFTTSVDYTKESNKYFISDDRPVILFDGVCNLCNTGVNFMLDHDKQGKVRFAALQSTAGKALLARSGRDIDDISSIVLVDAHRSYVKSDAILRIAQYLELPYPPLGSLGLLAPVFLRDTVYDSIANNRYSLLGKQNACRLSADGFEDRFLL